MKIAAALKTFDMSDRSEFGPDCMLLLYRCSTEEQNRIVISFTLIERKSRMPQIQGIKGEAVVNYCEPLDNAGDGVSSAFPQSKQNGIFPKFYISSIEEM